MAELDKVPGDLKLYIGGLYNLRRQDVLLAGGVTHILSVLTLPLPEIDFKAFTHKAIDVDDVEDENLLQYFPVCIQFIQDALETGGGVLVHCAMGKSRSATIVCAFLMHCFSMTPDQALARVRESRPFCEPNTGFWKQLNLYHEMKTPLDVDGSPMYQRWIYQRELERSREYGQAPEADKIRFEDESSDNDMSAAFELRCRKCRRTLATSQYLADHKSTGRPCTHYFMDPLSWMRPALEQGHLDGRLECPKCGTNVGKYAWQGMQCSCGNWAVPCISLAKSKIDEVKSRLVIGGIRMPPPPNGKFIAPKRESL
ncbi:dual specificity protein phosphatase 12 [Piedraia hortae CBS 480.64]|uniref:protein-tyrosine-phosphatase n=1 Tax=Piedraia hortae CBS 480.64 TaxID=1314780 RepID=A0A6A7BR91_9PEZI|nr:dual specificity protein phosphatase 12 [Piedraia hortae CBS 480.64]